VSIYPRTKKTVFTICNRIDNWIQISREPLQLLIFITDCSPIRTNEFIAELRFLFSTAAKLLAGKDPWATPT
jgi:hypothetical protein